MTARYALSRPRGFTLTELAVVLGVFGLVLGAVWSGASAVFQRQHVNDETLQVKTISDNIRALYSAATVIPYATGTDITTQMMPTSVGVVPASMIAAGQTYPVNVEGGAVHIIVGANSAGSTPQFQLTFNSTPKTCSSVLAYFSGLAADLNIAGVSVDGKTWLNPTTTQYDVTSFGGCTMFAILFNLR